MIHYRNNSIMKLKQLYILIASHIYLNTLCSELTSAFTILPPTTTKLYTQYTTTTRCIHPSTSFKTTIPSIQPPITIQTPKSTKLYSGVIVDVPENFFTIMGVTLGIALTLSRKMNRIVLENVAWENRLEDARMEKLQSLEEETTTNSSSSSNSMLDVTMTELDLRRVDAAMSKSAYGPEAMMERSRKKRKVRTMTTKEYNTNTDNDNDDKVRSDERKYTMTDDQITNFEQEFGIDYDPYYDEPYTIDELPNDMTFVEDKVYGDRRYENGEIFYRDEGNETLYWRQGGRPRLRKFWELF